MKSIGLLNSLLLLAVVAGAAMAQAEQRDAAPASNNAASAAADAAADASNMARRNSLPAARFDTRTPENAALSGVDLELNLELDDRAGGSKQPGAGALRRKAARAMR